MTRLLLAPHHDDLLLSVPATMASFTDRPKPMLVVCFSEESEALLRVCSALHREWEFDVVTLGLRESIQRGESIRQCIRPLRELSNLGEHGLFVQLRERLERLVRGEQAVSCLLPLLPVHIDHALCRAAAESIAGLGLTYYEDRPYAQICPHSLERESRGMYSTDAGVPRNSTARQRVLRALEALTEVVSPTQIKRIIQCYRADVLVHRGETLHSRDPAQLASWADDASSWAAAADAENRGGLHGRHPEADKRRDS